MSMMFTDVANPTIDTATIDWDALLGVINGGHPSDFDITGDTMNLAYDILACRPSLCNAPKWQEWTSIVRKLASKRSIKDLPKDVWGDTGFSWPVELYLEHRIDCETAVKLARLVNSTPPGHEHADASKLWKGYAGWCQETQEEDNKDEYDHNAHSKISFDDYDKNQQDALRSYGKAFNIQM